MLKSINSSAAGMKKLVLAVIFTLEVSYLLQFNSIFVKLPQQSIEKAAHQCPIPELSQYHVHQRVCHVQQVYEHVQLSQPLTPSNQAESGIVIHLIQPRNGQLEAVGDDAGLIQGPIADVNTDTQQAQVHPTASSTQLGLDSEHFQAEITDPMDNHSDIAQAPEAVVVSDTQQTQPTVPSTQADLITETSEVPTIELRDSQSETPHAPAGRAEDDENKSQQAVAQPTAPSALSGQNMTAFETQAVELRDIKSGTIQVPAAANADINIQPTILSQNPATPTADTADISTDEQPSAVGETDAAEQAQGTSLATLEEQHISISATQANEARDSNHMPTSEQATTVENPVGPVTQVNTLEEDLQQSTVDDAFIAEQAQGAPPSMQAVHVSSAPEARLVETTDSQYVPSSEHAEAVEAPPHAAHPADQDVAYNIASQSEKPSLDVITELGHQTAHVVPESLQQPDVEEPQDTATTELPTLQSQAGQHNLTPQQASSKSNATAIIAVAVTVVALCVLILVTIVQRKATARQHRRMQRLATLHQKERDYNKQYHEDNEDVADKQQQSPRSPMMSAVVADVAAAIASPLAAQGLRILHLASPPPPPPTRALRSSTRATSTTTATTTGSRRMTRSQAAEAAATDPRWDGLDAPPAPPSRPSRGRPAKAKA